MLRKLLPVVRILVAILALGCLAVLVFQIVLFLKPPGPPEIKQPGVERLTKGRVADDYPRWSPDGRLIAFQRGAISRPPGDVVPTSVDIWIVDVDRKQQTRVTRSGEYSGAFYPAWSPDGERIAFVEMDFVAKTSVLSTILIDGTDLTRIYECPTECHFPDWSPDGTQIVFVMPAEKGTTGRLFALTIADAEVAPIGTGGVDQFMAPRWSPDGDELIAWRFPGGIWIIPIGAHGPSSRCLPQGSDPAFSPDGRRIAFTLWGRDWLGSGLDRDTVFLSTRQGDSVTPVLSGTEHPDLSRPDWSPGGDQIVVRAESGYISHLYVIKLSGSALP